MDQPPALTILYITVLPTFEQETWGVRAGNKATLIIDDEFHEIVNVSILTTE